MDPRITEPVIDEDLAAFFRDVATQNADRAAHAKQLLKDRV
ncbi:MAG: hypothetical protein R6U94_04995 [Nitriliruptoraceae bacterium]